MIGLCRQFHCLPSQAVKEPAWVLRMLDIYRLGHRDEEPEGGE